MKAKRLERNQLELIRHRKVRRIFLLLNCLFEFFAGITGATFVLFLYRKGLNPMETNLVVAMSLMITFIMEIPTGALADSIGYMKTTLLSGILLAFTNVLFFFGETMPVFLVAQISLGVACSFESGTLDAWVIENTSPKESATIFILKNKYISIMMILSGLLGGVIADFYMEGIFLFSFVAAVSYIFIGALVMPKVETVEKKKNGRQISKAILGVRNIVKDSVEYCIQDKNIRNIILFNSLLTFAFSPVFVFWSPVLHSFEHVNYTVIGFAWVFMRTAMLIGNTILQKKQVGSFLALAFMTMICGISVFALAFLSGFWSLMAGILMFEFFLGIIYPLKETVLNSAISHKNRATILSFHSMVVSIFNYISMLMMGKIATMFSVETTWMISGSILVVAGVIKWIQSLGKKNKV